MFSGVAFSPRTAVTVSPGNRLMSEKATNVTARSTRSRCETRAITAFTTCSLYALLLQDPIR